MTGDSCYRSLLEQLKERREACSIAHYGRVYQLRSLERSVSARRLRRIRKLTRSSEKLTTYLNNQPDILTGESCPSRTEVDPRGNVSELSLVALVKNYTDFKGKVGDLHVLSFDPSGEHMRLVLFPPGQKDAQKLDVPFDPKLSSMREARSRVLWMRDQAWKKYGVVRLKPRYSTRQADRAAATASDPVLRLPAAIPLPCPDPGRHVCPTLRGPRSRAVRRPVAIVDHPHVRQRHDPRRDLVHDCHGMCHALSHDASS